MWPTYGYSFPALYSAYPQNFPQVENILQTTGKINLFRFIINPNDFGQSVENLFYLSFVIRDGRCAMDFSKGEPMIRVFSFSIVDQHVFDTQLPPSGV